MKPPASARDTPAADLPTASGQADQPSGGARVAIPFLELLPDDELERLNRLLPWAAFVEDQHGRRFGAAYSPTKRNVPQAVPDPRIVELDRRVKLAGRTILELGCFEGIHTTALAALAGRVLACDSRIENVVKTLVRCAMFGTAPQVFRWDVEEPPPPGLDLRCDVLHHVGVLYHLTDPVAHLRMLAPLVGDTIMLDTQIAPPDAKERTYTTDGETWQYMHYQEGGREAPFAGMLDHAKWLFKDDLLDLVRTLGFTQLDVASLTQERFGPRLLLYARR